MIEVNVLKNQLVVTEREQITSGSVNVYAVHFHFTSDWDELEKVAVFQAPGIIINVPINNNIAVIPWEVMTTPGVIVQLGVYGIKTLTTILPTIWTNLGTVVEGVIIGDAESTGHTPDIYETILQKFKEIDEELKGIHSDIRTDNEIYQIINEYLTKNPPSVDSSTLSVLINNYFEKNPIKGITREEVQQMIDETVGSAIRSGY